MPLDTVDETQILAHIQSWPTKRKLNLVQTLLRSVAEELPTAPAHPRALEDLIGLLETDQPAPSDEQCRQLLDDALVEKHLR